MSHPVLADVDALRREGRYAEAARLHAEVLDGPERQSALDYGCLLYSTWAVVEGIGLDDMAQRVRELQGGGTEGWNGNR